MNLEKSKSYTYIKMGRTMQGYLTVGDKFVKRSLFVKRKRLKEPR